MTNSVRRQVFMNKKSHPGVIFIPLNTLDKVTIRMICY